MGIVRTNARPGLTSREWTGYLLFAAYAAIFLVLCGTGVQASEPLKHPSTAAATLAKMGYTIQVGAFAKVENAANLAETLRLQDIDATYFLAKEGLYKVRFGNYSSRDISRIRAETLRKAGVIGDFYIVSPDQYTVAREQKNGTSYVRAEIVKTARSFLGIPYLWGGDSPETGFDCSGLVTACYSLNGLNLPRMSQDQFLVGEPVDREELSPGDLVFFANTNEKISHVGIYIGGGKFIHAPRQGKIIREDSLSDAYYEKRFRGGRSYFGERIK
jgi:cell wall-associated NlpC family hydrolase